MGEDAGLVADQVGDAAHQGTATGQHDAAIDDVGRQFRRGALQGALHGLNDHVQGLGHGFADVAGAHIDGAGQATEQVQATHIHGGVVVVVIGEGRADPNLDLLSRALAHHQVVHLLEIDADGVAEFVARHPHRLA